MEYLSKLFATCPLMQGSSSEYASMKTNKNLEVMIFGVDIYPLSSWTPLTYAYDYLS
jgi:hypothetical protein